MSDYDHAFEGTIRAALSRMPDASLRHVAARGARVDAVRRGAVPVAGTALYDHAPRGALLRAACVGAAAFAHGVDGKDATARSTDRAYAERLDGGSRVMDRAVSGALVRVSGRVKVRAGNGARGPSTGAPRPAVDACGAALELARRQACADVRRAIADHGRAGNGAARRAARDLVRAVLHRFRNDADVIAVARDAGWPV